MEDCIAAKLRPDGSDSERTRLLKEVLKSAVDISRMNGGRPQSSKLMGTAVATFKRQVPCPGGQPDHPLPQRESAAPASPLRPGSGAMWQSAPDLRVAWGSLDSPPCAEALGDLELSPILRDTGERISGICARLGTPEVLPAPTCHSPAVPAGSGIRIVERPREGAGVAQAREDKAAYAYISAQKDFFRHADELEERIGGSPGFDELRELFPRHCRRHPTVFLLTDQSLQDRADFRSTMWGSFQRHRAECPLEQSVMNMSMSGASQQPKARLLPRPLTSAHGSKLGAASVSAASKATATERRRSAQNFRKTAPLRQLSISISPQAP